MRISILQNSVVLISLLFGLSGCLLHYTNLGYKEAVKKYKDFEIHATFSQVFTRPGDTTTKKSPYNLLVSFISQADEPQWVYLERIEIVNDKTKEVVFEKTNMEELIFGRRRDGEHSAFVRFSELDLVHVSYAIKIRFKVKINDSTMEGEAALPLKRERKKEWLNLWDVMMSI